MYSEKDMEKHQLLNYNLLAGVPTYLPDIEIFLIISVPAPIMLFLQILTLSIIVEPIPTKLHSFMFTKPAIDTFPPMKQHLPITVLCDTTVPKFIMTLSSTLVSLSIMTPG